MTIIKIPPVPPMVSEPVQFVAAPTGAERAIYPALVSEVFDGKVTKLVAFIEGSPVEIRRPATEREAEGTARGFWRFPR